MIEMVVAFMVIFTQGDMGTVERIQTHDDVLRICQEYYPEGRVSMLPPVAIVSMDTGQVSPTPHVWACLRPMTKEDQQRQPEETTPDVRL